MRSAQSTSVMESFLTRHRNEIISQWVRKLKSDVSSHYTARPTEELTETVTEAFDTNCQILLYDNRRPIDHFIEKITRLRLKAGFSLTDVQMAFELFRQIVTPMLYRSFSLDDFHIAVTRINQCLAYTIHQFSDYFQGMHEKTIRMNNKKLTEEVRRRTADLAESKRKYKTLVEEINDGYVVIRNGKIVFANRAFADIHGYRADAVTGALFLDFVAPQSRAAILEIYHCMAMPSPPLAIRAVEYNRLSSNGSCYPTEILARLADYDHKLSVIGICRDITERVKMEKKVRDADRMATIGQITTSLSHEIRNPLSAIKLNLQVIQKNASLKGYNQRRIDISVSEVKRLEGILEEILDFAKPLRLKLVACDINDLIRGYIELLAEKLRERAICARFTCDIAMPTVYLDREKFQQAVVNLLFNAMDASPDQGVLDIRSGVVRRRGRLYAAVAIEDQGTGVPERLLAEIRKPFFTTKKHGTGLGLTNAERVVQAHGGWLEVDAKMPSGAAFTLILPLKSDAYAQNTTHR